MKRRDLLKRIAEQAKADGEIPSYTEGGSHTKVSVGNRQSVVPRHTEIKEPLVRQILKDLKKEG